MNRVWLQFLGLKVTTPALSVPRLAPGAIQAKRSSRRAALLAAGAGSKALEFPALQA